MLLAENPNAKPLDKSQESLRFVREACFLDWDAMNKISEQCFPDGDQRLQSPKRLTGLALVDKDKGVVGYCLYDKDERSIYDMAVLPEYRTDKNASSGKLFTETIKKVKEIGGEWSAELRDKTTYRYMEIMQQRGLVSFETHGVDHEMSDGSKVYSVTFKVDDIHARGNNLQQKDLKKIKGSQVENNHAEQFVDKLKDSNDFSNEQKDVAPNAAIKAENAEKTMIDRIRQLRGTVAHKSSGDTKPRKLTRFFSSAMQRLAIKSKGKG